jgi:hypothetical protein
MAVGVLFAATMAAQSHPEVADPGKAWTQKTPWGDPDLSGAWTSDDMRGVPRERAAEYTTRRYLTDEEFNKRAAADTQGRDREAKRSGGFRNDTGTRTFRQTSLVIDPPDGHIPAFTPWAESRRATRDRGSFGEGPFDSPADFTLYDRCITRGVIGSMLPVIYGNGNRWSQSPGYLTITYEMIHDTRVIPTDGRPHTGSKIHLWLGNSVGHWEGDELVVETTNFTNQTAIGVNGNGNRHSTQLKLIERFKRVAKNVVQYQVTIDDPLTYERPWTMSFPLTPLDGGRILPYTCHEGNMALTQSLGGERAEDRALAEDLKKGIVRARRPVQDGLGVGGAPVGPGGGGLFGGRGGAPPTPGADTQER